MSTYFDSADILLPDLTHVDPTRWAVLACDQYTSEPDYWARVEETVGDAPSMLDLILPEVYLEQADARLPKIAAAMKEALASQLCTYPHAMLALARTQSDGRIRRGLIGVIDLEQYDFSRGATSLIRATEGTVLERIPPRVAVRKQALIESPHIMLLIDDRERTVIEPLHARLGFRTPLYDFDLMLGGGHVRAHLLTNEEQATVQNALASLITPAAMQKRYGDGALAPLLFAVGDGNHSLATAKTVYEGVKSELGAEAAKDHPARYALCEVVNLHDDALSFEPIYRVVFGADVPELLAAFECYLAAQSGTAAEQRFCAVWNGGKKDLSAKAPTAQLCVGTLQAFLDAYMQTHPEITVDYIHGEDSLKALASRPDAVGFLFEGMRKDELFRTVIYDGALPRKTFSMGHAPDKRYYIECRKITQE